MHISKKCSTFAPSFKIRDDVNQIKNPKKNETKMKTEILSKEVIVREVCTDKVLLEKIAICSQVYYVVRHTTINGNGITSVDFDFRMLSGAKAMYKAKIDEIYSNN